jgi:hypothetical protein
MSVLDRPVPWIALMLRLRLRVQSRIPLTERVVEFFLNKELMTN